MDVLTPPQTTFDEKRKWIDNLKMWPGEIILFGASFLSFPRLKPIHQHATTNVFDWFDNQVGKELAAIAGHTNMKKSQNRFPKCGLSNQTQKTCPSQVFEHPSYACVYH